MRNAIIEQELGRTKPRIFILAMFVLCLVEMDSPAQNFLPIFPPGHSTTDGNSFSTIPFSGGASTVRFQQIYDASGFVAQGGTIPYLIRSINFRVDAGRPGFGSQFPDFQINLSTTSRSIDGLSSLFTDNVGADDTAIVARGSFSFAVNSVGDFNSIFLTTPFYYDPSRGNLLLDIRNFGGGNTIWGIPPFTGPAYVDASNVTGDRVSRVFANDVDALSGTADSLGLVTQFWITPVPEPPALALLAVGLGVLALGWKRMKKGKEAQDAAH